MMIAGVIVGVGLLCAVVVLYRRMKTYSASLVDINAKLDTLTRLTENDGEALVDTLSWSLQFELLDLLYS